MDAINNDPFVFVNNKAQLNNFQISADGNKLIFTCQIDEKLIYYEFDFSTEELLEK